jgi:hypothetical protein
MTTGTIGTFARHAAPKAPGRNRLNPGVATKVPTIHELGAYSPQQKPGEGKPCHLMLDNERESRRQRRGQNNPVEVTRVVGDDHASAVWQGAVAAVLNRTSDRQKEASREPARDATAGVSSWKDGENR